MTAVRALAPWVVVVFAFVVVVQASARTPSTAPGLEVLTTLPTLGEFTLSPDGRQAAFGVAGHYFGFPATPRLGERGNLHVVSLEDGRIRQVTSGPETKTDPVFSPSGRFLAYLSDGHLWVADLHDGRAWRTTTGGGEPRSPSWSPDGTEIAFIASRGGQTDVWAADFRGERHGLRRLTSDTIAESDVQWGPDGRHLLLTARAADDHYFAQGIYLVSLADATSRRLTPKDPVDNFSPRWSPDGRSIAFISDRSGFARVWTMTPDGGALRELDTGEGETSAAYWQVEPRWSPDGRRILVSVNREARFDLVEIDVTSGRSTTIGSKNGRHDAVGWASDGQPVFGHQNGWSLPNLFHGRPGPSARRLTHADHVGLTPDFAAEVRRVRFDTSDALSIPGMLLRPREPSQRRLPAIVVLHPNSYGQFYDYWSPFLHHLAQSGFVVLLVDQRGSAGYGRAFRDLAVGQWGTGTVKDVIAAARFLGTDELADGACLGVMGLSFGAYNTLMALVESPATFRAGISLMGVADRRPPFASRNTVFHLGASPAERPDLYDRVSPITRVNRLEAPLLVVHADQDRNVPVQQSYHLVDELERQQKAFEFVVYRNEAHGLADPANVLDSYRRILGFFKRHLEACPAVR